MFEGGVAVFDRTDTMQTASSRELTVLTTASATVTATAIPALQTYEVGGGSEEHQVPGKTSVD